MPDMRTLDVIALDTNWVYCFTQNSKSHPSDSAWIPLPYIGDWAVGTTVEKGVDWFKRSVLIEPTNTCVEYFLCVENVPEVTSVYVNGKQIAEVQANSSCRLNVTHCVALGVNEVALKVMCKSHTPGGIFGSMFLESVPCDGVFPI